MKTLKLFPALVTLLVLSLTVSCSQDDSLEYDNETNSRFEITPISQNKATDYTTNYEITQYSIVDNKIDLEITTPAGDYSFLKAYNISTSTNTAILYLITRNDTEAIVNNPVSHLITDTIDLNALNIDANNVNNNITIFVMNNASLIAEDDTILDCLKDNALSKELSGQCSSQSTNKVDGPRTSNGGIIL